MYSASVRVIEWAIIRSFFMVRGRGGELISRTLVLREESTEGGLPWLPDAQVRVVSFHHASLECPWNVRMGGFISFK